MFPPAASARRARRASRPSPAITSRWLAGYGSRLAFPRAVVGLIANPKQAEAIVAEGSADMVALARAFLDDPHWAWHAALALGGEVTHPPQYRRAAPGLWPGAKLRAST